MKELPNNNSKFIFFKQHINNKLNRIINDSEYSKTLTISVEELIIINESLINIDDMKIVVDTENSLIIATFNMNRTIYKMSIEDFKNKFSICE